MSEFGDPAITAATLRGGLDAVLGAVLDGRPGLTREGRALARHTAARSPAWDQARRAVAAFVDPKGASLDDAAAQLAEAGQALHLLARAAEVAADLLTQPSPY